ncbi:MAG: maleylpyruvate isomerase N-terminal domain-containing protein [Actinomycetota bacterium]
MGEDVAALIDRDAASGALVSYTSRLCAILRTDPDRDSPAIGTWTLGDVANHVAWGIENYTRWLQGADAPDLDAVENMARWNIETVRALPPADLSSLADRIEVATDEFSRSAENVPASSEVRWYAGNRIPVEVAITMRLGEAAVHGLDIAAAAKHEWVIDPDAARAISYGLGYIAPYLVSAEKLDFNGTIRVRIRRGSDLYYIIEDRHLHVRTEGPGPGWNLSVAPVGWVLVTTGRRNQWMAAGTGKIVGWGTRPSLPFRLRAASFQG